MFRWSSRSKDCCCNYRAHDTQKRSVAGSMAARCPRLVLAKQARMVPPSWLCWAVGEVFLLESCPWLSGHTEPSRNCRTFYWQEPPPSCELDMIIYWISPISIRSAHTRSDISLTVERHGCDRGGFMVVLLVASCTPFNWSGKSLLSKSDESDCTVITQ